MTCYKFKVHQTLTPFLCRRVMTQARHVDSAESGVLPGRNDVGELEAAARSSCENCSLCLSPLAALSPVYCLSLLSSAVPRL